MARPKERVCSLSPYHSPAFVEKCSREKENLHGHVANRLKDDILRCDTQTNVISVLETPDKTKLQWFRILAWPLCRVPDALCI